MARNALVSLAALTMTCAVAMAQPVTVKPVATQPGAFAAADRLFEDYRLDAHIPGLVYGIVIDGRLVHTGAFGVQDLESRRPVTAHSLFRIASMTKAFTALTILKLRDDGLLRLDAAAEDYVPEMRDWKYPTEDSPRIRVRDLLNHAAGFVTDDPWGDRQTPMPEADFTRLLREGVPFTRAPETAFEYSNFGYALLGRIITTVSSQPFAATITRTILGPLHMDDSGFEAEAAPLQRRAQGYRWEDDAWRAEPTLGPGAFGAMGGLQTSADDYAKWLVFLLSAWPPRDGADGGPAKRATVREMALGSNFLRVRARFGRSGAEACRQAAAYGMGLIVAVDCERGVTLSHGGGYPGYGSHVLLLPERGAAVFAFANRTYAGPSAPVWDAALVLQRAGVLPPERKLPVSSDLAGAYRIAAAMYVAGSVTAAGDLLAMNFLLDRDAAGWSRDLSTLKAQAGDCETQAPITATGALTGEFVWRCGHGRVKGSLSLAPTLPPRLQQLKLAVVAP